MQESEARLRDAIESIPEGFVLYDAEERLILCNSQYRDFYPSIADMLKPGAKLEDLARTAYEAGAIRGSAKKVEARIEQRLTDYRTAQGSHEQQLKDGRWLLCGERHTSTGGIACTRTDITKRKRAEEEVKTLNEELEQRVEQRTAELRAAQEALLRKSRLAALGQLTGTVSHELRNPLGALRTSIAAIRRLAPDDQEMMRRSIAIADRSVTRCDVIISDLLEYSRVRALNRAEVALDDWLPAVLDEIELPAGVELARSLDCGLELSLDPDRLRRVVVNLVDNACQAMTADALDGADEDEARERRLAVSTRATKAQVELRIADTGPGMDAETLAKIFEPLYSTKTFGVGLGLTVVKQIMEQHGGGVEIASAPGAGTEVVLWLPLPEPARKAAS